MANEKSGGRNQDHGNHEPYRSALQSIANAIKELRESVAAIGRAAESAEKSKPASPGPMVVFWQTWLPIILNGLLLIVVFSQAFYAYLQWTEMQRTERAWVVVQSTAFKYVKDQQGVDRADALLGFQNTGPSPAFNVHIWRCSQIREVEPSVDAGPSGTPPCQDNQIGMMGTGIPLGFEMPDVTHIIPENSLPQTAYTPGLHLYVWGKIMYDIFSKDKQHFTSFCLLSAGGATGPLQQGE